MKKVLCLLLVLAAAAPVFPFSVGTYQGRPCYHTSGQIPWTMSFNQYGTPDCTNEWAQFLAALNTWSNVSHQWYRNAQGPYTTTVNIGYDPYNLCVWYEPEYVASYGQGTWASTGASTSTIAFNMYWMQDLGTFWEVTHNDIAMNGYNYAWSDAGASGRMDVQDIAAHELGHNLVLADLYGGGDYDKTMYGYSGPGETYKRDLHSDDIAGIRYLYGYPGIRLDFFTARARDGGVELSWKATEDPNHAGYNLYRRADDGKAAYEKVNGALIRGSSPYNWRDEDPAAGNGYQYLLEAVDLKGKTERYGPARVTLPGVKASFSLAACYPNPARESVTIKYGLATAGEARLAVYDLSGRKVATVAEGAAAVGEHDVTWNLTTAAGARVAPGIYVYRLEAGGATAARRMVVAR
jgi:hypothetical protein